MDWQVIAPQLVALTLGLFGVWQSLRKQNAESETAYLTALREDLEKLRDRMDNLEDYIGLLETHISAMTITMGKAGLQAPERPTRRQLRQTKE
jgi:hypothetical protein